MSDENPQKLALEWLNNILARVREVEAQNVRIQEIIARKPTGTKAQREAQMLKRTEAAETESGRLREALETIKVRAEGYEHGDSQVTAAFRGIATIVRVALAKEGQ